MTKLTTIVRLTPAQQLWVDALRSGEYSQTTETLQDTNGYCCLGVACQVAKNQGIKVHITAHSGLISGGELSDQRAVWNWLGLRNSTGYTDQWELTHLNDECCYTFPQLADFIEEHAAQLFIQKENLNETNHIQR